MFETSMMIINVVYWTIKINLAIRLHEYTIEECFDNIKRNSWNGWWKKEGRGGGVHVS
jgi:hypothetical protein